MVSICLDLISASALDADHIFPSLRMGVSHLQSLCSDGPTLRRAVHVPSTGYAFETTRDGVPSD